MKAICLLTFTAILAAPTVWAAAPIIDDPVPLDGTSFPTKVEPKVPVGKVLLFPITATDADGDVLTYKVTSNNPAILVRVRTAQTRLKMNVTHAAGAETDPAFEGTMEFLLFRDLTPITSSYIAGFAQAPYYANQIFHRIANLDPTETPDGSIIVQGGDPLGTGSGGPGFQFANEFNVAAIFTGRGQLAMANGGINPLTFKGTNGSQFFVTAGQPRFLDYNHTIFGQLMRGWETFEKIVDAPRASDKPVVDVKLVSTSVEPNLSDAILMISATAPGTAAITVEVSDGTSPVVTKTFTVTAVKDTRNTPPFIEPIGNKSVAKETILDVPIKVVDLENDFVFYANQILQPINGQSSGTGNPARLVGNTGFTGQLNLGVGTTQFDMTNRGAIDGTRSPDDQVAVAVAVGDKKIEAEIDSFSAAPGVALTNMVVARYTDGDGRGRASDFSSAINWGDGTPLTTGVIARDASTPSPTAFSISGTHTYVNPGVYPLTVDLGSSKGQRVTLRGIAVITAGPLRPFGRTLKEKQKKLTDAIVATFTDDAPLGAAAYSATILWGDGDASEGTVRRTPKGQYQVLGSNKFTDPEDFSVLVRIRKTGGGEAFAWSTVEARGFEGKPHLPPFAGANLIGQIAQTTIPNSNPPTSIPIRETIGNQTFVSAEIVIVNGGTKATTASKVRFYLSQDKTLNLQDETGPDPNTPSQTIITNPKDRQLTIGSTGKTELDVDPLQPGAGVRYVLINQTDDDARLRLPVGDNGAGLNLLARLAYSDPLTNNLPVGKDVLFGPFDPFVVKPTQLQVQELGGTGSATVKPETATFTVKLAHQPTGNVSIAMTLSNADATQISITPTGTLVFTPENWNAPQTVTVKALDDTTTDGTKTATVTLGVADSTDLRFDNFNPQDVTVFVFDKATTTP